MNPQHPTHLFLPILKHTLKEVSALTKTFSNLKTSFLKSHKNSNLPQNALFSSTDKPIELIEKIATLSNTEIGLGKDPKHKSAMSIIKPNPLAGQQELLLAQKVLTEIVQLIQFTQPQNSTVQSLALSSNSILVFLLQKTLFLTRIKFQFCTFLTKIGFGITSMKEDVQVSVVRSVGRCQDDVRSFLAVWNVLSEREQDCKTYENMNKLSQEFKSHLMRIVAAFYQLIYNFSTPSPSTFTNFIHLANSLIKQEMSRPKLSQKQGQKVISEQTEKKPFWPFSKSISSSSKQNNMSSVSQSKSKSMSKKSQKSDSSLVSANQASFELIDEKNGRKKSVQKKQSILKSNENGRNTGEDEQISAQNQYLTKDEVEVIEFYRNSLIQRMFSVEKDELRAGCYKEFVDDLLSEYNFGTKLSEKSLPFKHHSSPNSLIEQTLMKLIYKDQNMKGANLTNSTPSSKPTLPYSQLLTRCHLILSHIHHHLTLPKFSQPSNYTSLLEFIITLYEKVMIAHKEFVENQTLNLVYLEGKNSFSQKSSAVQSVNIQSQSKFQVLYRINVVFICILAQLYDVPALNLEFSQKLASFNTLLTLHQVSFNQLNFPNNFSVFESVHSSDNDIQTPSYAQYYKSLSHLHTLLIKAHQITYKSLDMCVARHIEPPKSNQKMVKVQSVASHLKKSQQFEDHEDFILSYQNIIVQSLDEISVEFQECFFQYFEKNKAYLLDPNHQRFTYFKQISQNILNYIEFLMMIIYRRNHGSGENTKREVIPLKNNVMTSLKLIKVLDKIVVMFWQEFWDFGSWYDGGHQVNPMKEQMLSYVQDCIMSLLKLLLKFSIPKQTEPMDYRHLKSALIVAPLLGCYESKLRQVSRRPHLLAHLHKSKPFLKLLFEMTQRLSLPELIIKTQASSNLQTRSKLNEQVLQKMVSIFSINPQTQMNPPLINHHFSLLVQMLFDNFSRMKQSFEDFKFECIGQERFSLHMVGKMLREINSNLLIQKTAQKHPLLLSQKELQKITVILEMYLTEQNYNIELEIGYESEKIFTSIDQVQEAASKVFDEMVNFLVFSSLFRDGSYEDIVKMVLESKFLATEYLVFLKINLSQVKQILAKEQNQSEFEIQRYLQLCVQIYSKIMNIFTLNYDKTDTSEDTVSAIITASAIFHELLTFPQFITHISIKQLLSLQKIKMSLSANRFFSTFQFEVVMVEYFCQHKDLIKQNLSKLVETLRFLFEEMGALAEKEMAFGQENYWFVNKMVADFVDNSFLSNLYNIHLSMLAESSQNSVQSLQELKPTILISLINTSFIKFSQAFIVPCHSHHKTMSNLTVLQTPTFNRQNLSGSKKQLKCQTKQKKLIFGIEMTEELEEEKSELERNLFRGFGVIATEQQEEESQDDDLRQQKKELIVSELELHSDQDGNESDSDEDNGSIEQASDSQQLYESLMALADESYFSCSKVTAVKLYQEFYINLVSQFQTVSPSSNQFYQPAIKDLSSMWHNIAMLHVSKFSKMSLGDNEMLSLVKCHLKLMRNFQAFSQRFKTNEDDDKNFQALDSLMAKIQQLYLDKLQSTDDQEFRDILLAYASNEQKDRNSNSSTKNTQKTILDTNLQTDQTTKSQTNQKICMDLLQALQQAKQQLSKSQRNLTQWAEYFNCFKDELRDFILAEYKKVSQPERHQRRISFHPMCEMPFVSFSQLFDSIYQLLQAIAGSETLSDEGLTLYRQVYKHLEPVLIECMDLAQAAKRIKSIFKLNLKLSQTKLEP